MKERYCDYIYNVTWFLVNSIRVKLSILGPVRPYKYIPYAKV